MENVVKEVKTTIIGVLLVGYGIYRMYANSDSSILAIGLVVGGVLLAVSSDKIIDVVIDGVKSKLSNNAGK